MTQEEVFKKFKELAAEYPTLNIVVHKEPEPRFSLIMPRLLYLQRKQEAGPIVCKIFKQRVVDKEGFEPPS